MNATGSTDVLFNCRQEGGQWFINPQQRGIPICVLGTRLLLSSRRSSAYVFGVWAALVFSTGWKEPFEQTRGWELA